MKQESGVPAFHSPVVAARRLVFGVTCVHVSGFVRDSGVVVTGDFDDCSRSVVR